MKVIIGGPYPYTGEKITGGVESVINNLKHGINYYEPDIDLKIITGCNRSKDNIEKVNDIIYVKHPRVKLGSVFLSLYPYRLRKHFLI
jgi:hypothetical protein